MNHGDSRMNHDGAPRKGLFEYLRTLPDPRKPRGVRHPLTAMLGLAVLAMLGGAQGPTAIAQFGRDHGTKLLRALGFTRDQAPCVGSFHYLFKALDAQAFERALLAWLEAWFGPSESVLAIDGKRLNGSSGGPDLPGRHLLHLYAPAGGRLIASLEKDPSTNEHKAALEMLGAMDLSGQVVSGDAAFCQRDLSEKVLKKGATICGSSSRISRSCSRPSKRPSTRN